MLSALFLQFLYQFQLLQTLKAHIGLNIFVFLNIRVTLIV